MPLAIPGRTKDAVVVAATGSDWCGGVASFLRELGADDAKVGWHLDVLEQRWAGHMSWTAELADRTLSSGRPMPPGRAYAQMLETESLLPLYDVGGWLISIDLHNPENEADVAWYDASVVELAIVADKGAFMGPAVVGNDFARAYAERAERGAQLGELVASLAGHLQAGFAYADVGPTGGAVTAGAKGSSVVHPSTDGLRPQDFLWSITVWGPELLSGELAERLDRLTPDALEPSRIDPYVRPHLRLEQRTLDYGGRMLQYRFLFGSELRGERVHIDTPLAKRLGLRSTNLQYRA